MRLFRFLLYLSLFGLCLACKQTPSDSGINLSTNTYREYYSTATGKKEAELKTALFGIIGNTDIVSYAEIWSAFEKTDVKADGSVWDMYSDNPGGEIIYSFSFHHKKCGTYRSEGDCYNREHTIPQSWFKGASPMYSDLFHIYPTDGYVNNRRGNLPLGEVGIFSWKSANGSRIGQNTSGNFTQTVFEPIDEYKGDFARTFFYMVTMRTTWPAGNRHRLEETPIRPLKTGHLKCFCGGIAKIRSAPRNGTATKPSLASRKTEIRLSTIPNWQSMYGEIRRINLLI